METDEVSVEVERVYWGHDGGDTPRILLFYPELDRLVSCSPQRIVFWNPFKFLNKEKMISQIEVLEGWGQDAKRIRDAIKWKPGFSKHIEKSDVFLACDAFSIYSYSVVEMKKKEEIFIDTSFFARMIQVSDDTLFCHCFNGDSLLISYSKKCLLRSLSLGSGRDSFCRSLSFENCIFANIRSTSPDPDIVLVNYNTEDVVKRFKCLHGKLSTFCNYIQNTSSDKKEILVGCGMNHFMVFYDTSNKEKIIRPYREIRVANWIESMYTLSNNLLFISYRNIDYFEVMSLLDDDDDENNNNNNKLKRIRSIGGEIISFKFCSYDRFQSLDDYSKISKTRRKNKKKKTRKREKKLSSLTQVFGYFDEELLKIEERKKKRVMDESQYVLRIFTASKDSKIKLAKIRGLRLMGLKNLDMVFLDEDLKERVQFLTEEYLLLDNDDDDDDELMNNLDSGLFVSMEICHSNFIEKMFRSLLC